MFGRNALMVAAANGHSYAVRALLAYGTDAHLKDKSGETALDSARVYGHSACAAILEEHEQYLAQLGSHTKRALRETEQPTSQAGVSASAADGIPLSVPPVETSAATGDLLEETEVSQCEVAPQHALANATEVSDDLALVREQQAVPAPVMDLRDLDFELPQ
eukprot:m.349834 g.349834  ORF g.349834 m.349834 type:complete len:162 (+) comp55888_c0_seq1:326-811(+)